MPKPISLSPSTQGVLGVAISMGGGRASLQPPLSFFKQVAWRGIKGFAELEHILTLGLNRPGFRGGRLV